VILNDYLFHLKEEIEEALRKALKTVNAGPRLSEIGRVVLGTAKLCGLRPMERLRP